MIRAASAGTGRIEVVDFYGRTILVKEVQLEEGENQLALDAGALTPGIYFAKAVFNNQMMITKMIRQ